MSDEEGAICDECGSRIGPNGCCATARTHVAQKIKLEAVGEAALALMERLGGEDGYFPTAGAPTTYALRDALRTAGYKIQYGQK